MLHLKNHAVIDAVHVGVGLEIQPRRALILILKLRLELLVLVLVGLGVKLRGPSSSMHRVLGETASLLVVDVIHFDSIK